MTCLTKRLAPRCSSAVSLKGIKPSPKDPGSSQGGYFGLRRVDAPDHRRSWKSARVTGHEAVISTVEIRK
jgi:hypothetical protein